MSRKKRRQQKKESAHRENPSLILNEALRLYKSGNLKLALRKCQSVLTGHPQHPHALNLGGSIYMDLGQTQQSVNCLRSVVKVHPDSSEAHFNLGTALTANGELEEAISSQRRALELKPDYAQALFNLGNAYRQTNELETAILSYRNALDLVPDYPGAATNLASSLLRLGRPQDALDASNQALKFYPGDRDALAFKAIAATEVGDPDSAASILSMDRIIRKKDFDAPAGFADLAEFNKALVKHVLSHPTLTREPANVATRHGQQTENLALEPRGPIAQLQEMIIAAYDEYMSSVSKDVDHSYIRQIPDLSKIDIWGTVLDRTGHQTAHMHRNAWISGVYYAQLPDVMHSVNESRSGWIEFGRPPDEFRCTVEHRVRMFEPREGRMFMFPSFEFHRTIPFESSQQRISIAFDLLA
ncbi:MAG: tetratricopeptide repeat protein [Gammaproteobacteria bacterium]|nr:tetratricopeptide repeat protein [Gammaproteobacteria bacterium]